MSKDFVLLKALRRDAKDGFFEKGELLEAATEDCAECANGALNFRVDVCTECEESSEVTESPRVWKKLRSPRSATGVEVVGESKPDCADPQKPPAPARPNAGVELKLSSSSKSTESSSRCKL